jgi:hypothetical protein
MDKYLPIKFYQRREDVDDRFTPAVGGDEQPKWVLEGDNNQILLPNRTDN